MEPRHHEQEADEIQKAHEPERDDLELGPDEDDTGYDEELEDDDQSF